LAHLRLPESVQSVIVSILSRLCDFMLRARLFHLAATGDKFIRTVRPSMHDSRELARVQLISFVFGLSEDDYQAARGP
jgi:hypothetical protein